MSNRPSVLFCPLDWGIGHATRCVPIIREFMKNGFEVILAADGRALDFLKLEFPECRAIRFPGVKIRYTSGEGLSWKMFLSAPALFAGIFREHRALKQLIRTEKPVIIFSDNRYGLWNKDFFCIFMTHQLDVIPPGIFRVFRTFLNKILHHFIRKFDECWVPDVEAHGGLAGELSHPGKISFCVNYIGFLSRFRKRQETQVNPVKEALDFMVILSGPEPQRSNFEKIIMQQANGTDLHGIILSGKTEVKEETSLGKNIRVFSHLETEQMRDFILSSGVIICRPGYSSLMDLAILEGKPILVPTPGQTEQEYLAHYLEKKIPCFTVSQSSFSLVEAIEKSRNFPRLKISYNDKLMEDQVKRVSLKGLTEKIPG